MDFLNEAKKMAADTNLVEALIRSNKYAPLTKSQTCDMRTLLQNTQNNMKQELSEGTLTSDVAPFTPIILPMVRRIFPSLIANELLGVQPMSSPTGFIYALTNQYLGDGEHKVGDSTKPAGVIYEVEDEDALTVSVGDTAGTGTVVYIEGNKVLCSFGASKLAINDTSLGSKIVALYTNEAAFGRILKNFSGSYSTSEAEQLAENMREIGFNIDRKMVDVKSRALKGRYTVELYQDLRNQHNLNADEELMSLMQYEILAELDRETVDFVNSNSTPLADTTFAFPAASSTNVIIPDGRWEIERYRAQVIRIAKEAAMIGLETKRGQGNTLLVSPLVATMLEQVGSFQLAPVASDVSAPVSGGVAGTFDNRYKVVIDQYATSDYCTVLYKGEDRRDAMGFYSPYVPLQFTRVTNAESGQPAIIAKTRYAMTTIPGVESADSKDRAMTYARSFGIDFSNTMLAR